MTQNIFSVLFLLSLFAPPVTVLLSAVVALWPSGRAASAVNSAKHAAAHA